jgi:hypothetical protein
VSTKRLKSDEIETRPYLLVDSARWTVNIESGHRRKPQRASGGVARGRPGPAKGGFVRQLIIIGIVILGLGAAALLRGDAFGSADARLSLADPDPSAEDAPLVSPWIAGGAVVAGIAMIMMAARPRS